jgi:multidrug efflux pump subunit AcrB
MEGAARALFLPLSLAVGFSMAASYVLSSTLLPVLAASLLPRGGAHGEAGFMAPLSSLYRGLLGSVLRAPGAASLAGLLAAVLLGWLLVPGLGKDIFPAADHGQLQVRLRAAPGTRLDVTEAIALRALDLIKAELGPANVGTTLGLVGVHAPNYPVNLVHAWNSGTDEATLQVQLKTGVKSDLAAAKERLRARFARELPGVRASFEPADIVSRVMSFGASTPIEVAVSGPGLADNRAHAEKIRDELAKIPELRDLQFAQTLDYPVLEVNIDREKAGRLGLRHSEAARSVVAGTFSTRFILSNYWADPKNGVAYQVQVQVPAAAVKSAEDIANLPVGPGGAERGPVLLRSVATLKPSTAVAQYDRYNMQRLVTLTANFHGSDLGSLAEKVDAAVAAAGAPPAKVKVDVRGQVAPMRELLDGLRTGLLAALAVIALLLTASFQNLRAALAVLAPIPAVLAGGAALLLLTGSTLNIESYIGLIMAVGVSVANCILLVTAAEERRRAGLAAEAAADEAGRSRLRAVLMTAGAMLAGMLPMALGLTEAGEQTAPLGRAVIGGLLLGTPATLLLVPAAYAALHRGRAAVSPSLDPDDPSSPHHAPHQA